MFTHRLFYLLLVVALMIATACTPTSSNVVPSPSAEAPTTVQTTTSIKPFPHMPLPPGTYTSEVFDTPLTYTVPTGWKMFEDEPGQFGLALLENDGPCLCIWRDVRAAATSCAEEPEPSIGSSASDIAGWLSMHEGLITTEPEPVSIGGLDGYMIDVRMDPDWTNDCPFSNGEPVVMTLVGTDISAGVHWGTDKSSAQRYYLLDLGEDGADGNIAITVEVCCGAQWEERVKAVTPVVESFVFNAK